MSMDPKNWPNWAPHWEQHADASDAKTSDDWVASVGYGSWYIGRPMEPVDTRTIYLAPKPKLRWYGRLWRWMLR